MISGEAVSQIILGTGDMASMNFKVKNLACLHKKTAMELRHPLFLLCHELRTEIAVVLSQWEVANLANPALVQSKLQSAKFELAFACA